MFGVYGLVGGVVEADRVKAREIPYAISQIYLIRFLLRFVIDDDDDTW